MKIEYITDVLSAGFVKHVVSINNKNHEVLEVARHGVTGGLAYEFGKVRVCSKTFEVYSNSFVPLTQYVLAVQVAQVIEEHKR